MDDEDRPPLPKLSEKEELKLLELKPEQHFTEPPPRFTEASLVKALEENGIGRPSTYASIISTIKDRKYVELTQKRFFPTELGFKVTDLLVKHFPSVLDIAFTAKVETQLDDVEQGRQDWVDLLRNFYGPFEKDLEEAKANMEQVKIEPKETDQSCPNCGRKMVIREGPYGPFIACSGYPECKTILKEQKTTGVTCPKCGKGEILERKSKKQKIFYGCNKYPDCDFVSWDRPTGENCPVCGGFLVEKVTKSRGHEVRCIDRACKYSRKAENEETEGIEAA